MFGNKSRLQREALAEISSVLQRAAKGDLSARIVFTEKFGEIGDILAQLNQLLDLTDAFVREAGASLQFAAEGKFYRPFLLRGMCGDFRRGAEVINLAREAMHTKTLAADAAEKSMQDQREKLEAEARRQRAELAAQFESKVGAIVSTVSSASETLENSSHIMSDEIDNVRLKSEASSEASKEATNNTQAVAAAAEQLAASVEEIRRQIEECRAASQLVTNEVSTASVNVKSLDQANMKIDEVVEFIKSVAFQTNLLALNASVEAARAGDAGKGFAVVAQEVRNLASKTSEAAKSIAEQISEIKLASSKTVNSIFVIQGEAAKLNDRVVTITESAQEQSSATNEISNNIQSAAARTELVSTNVSDILNVTIETGKAASDVAKAAAELRVNASDLSAHVAHFLEFIRRM